MGQPGIGESYFSLVPTVDSAGNINGYDLILSDQTGLFGGVNVSDTLVHFVPTEVNSSELIPTFVNSGVDGRFIEKRIGGKDVTIFQEGQPVQLNGKYLAILDPNDGVHGDEIWVSDGTVAGTYMLKDINPGSASSNAGEFAIINEELYFVADDGTDGKQLWKSDGTTAGTVMVTDINPGNFNPVDMTSVGNELFFFANDGVHGQELWASDGTTAGTAMVTDLVPGSGSTFPTNFAASNGKFFFDAFVTGLGDELFESDGTQAGTFVVKDINPGSFGSNPRELTDVNGTLYFTANDGTHGDQIWKTDGTAANTVMVTAPGHFADNFFPLYNFDGKLVFDAPLFSDGVHGQTQLYITDGTDAGTTALTSVNSFRFQPQAFFAIGNQLYFTANDGTHGTELWVSDGTPGGTEMLADINPSGSSNPTEFSDVGGLLFFNAFDGTSEGVWVTDGTAANTQKLYNTAGLSPITSFDTSPCYCRDTLILTDNGDTSVQDLKIGDRVVTAKGASRPIKWIGRRSYEGRFVWGRKDILPICIKAGALADGVPRRDLWISPHHAMYLDEVLIEAKDLVNGASIVQAEQVESVEYFHIELDTHDVILAEGAPSESFLDDDSRGMFHNAHEFDALYPDAVRTPAPYCAARIEAGYEVEAVRQRLAQRAGLASGQRHPGPLRGYVDGMTACTVEGWAQDVDYPDAPVCLELYVGNQIIGQMLANRYRTDLRQAGLGSGHHAFQFVLPPGMDVRPDILQVRRSLDGATLTFLEGLERQRSAAA